MVDPSSCGSELPAASLPARDIRELVSSFYGDVYRYAYRLCGRQADAEDLTQQTFLIAQRRLHQLRDPTKANRWLFAVLRSCFLKSVGRPRLLSIEGSDMDVADPAESPWEGRSLDQEALQQALGELPIESRVVVLMFYFEELSYREIAGQLEVPIGTVMSRLARAKMRLREKLFADSAGGGPEAAGAGRAAANAAGVAAGRT